jgi:hypothetical protein
MEKIKIARVVHFVKLWRFGASMMIHPFWMTGFGFRIGVVTPIDPNNLLGEQCFVIALEFWNMTFTFGWRWP